MCGIYYSTENLLHCPFREKCLYLEEFSGPYFPAFWTEYGEIRSIFQYLVLNEGKFGPEKLQIRTLFPQWLP